MDHVFKDNSNEAERAIRSAIESEIIGTERDGV